MRWEDSRRIQLSLWKAGWILTQPRACLLNHPQQRRAHEQTQNIHSSLGMFWRKLRCLLRRPGALADKPSGSAEVTRSRMWRENECCRDVTNQETKVLSRGRIEIPPNSRGTMNRDSLLNMWEFLYSRTDTVRNITSIVKFKIKFFSSCTTWSITQFRKTKQMRELQVEIIIFFSQIPTILTGQLTDAYLRSFVESVITFRGNIDNPVGTWTQISRSEDLQRSLLNFECR